MCHDTDTGRDLAVKKITFAGSDREVSRQIAKLESELNILRSIPQHQHLVQYQGVCLFLDVGESVVVKGRAHAR